MKLGTARRPDSVGAGPPYGSRYQPSWECANVQCAERGPATTAEDSSTTPCPFILGVDIGCDHLSLGEQQVRPRAHDCGVSLFSECVEPATIERDCVSCAFALRCVIALHDVRVSTGGVHPVQRYSGLDAGSVNRNARAVSPIASARVQRKRCTSQQVAGLRVGTCR